MSDELSLQTQQALYWAGQWKQARTRSTAIPDDLDEKIDGLGEYEGEDEWGETYKTAIAPGRSGGRQVLYAVGDCADGVDGGLTDTVTQYIAADHRSSDLIK